MRATKYVALALLLVLSLTLLLHGNLPQISSGAWTPANNLAEARSGSAAVVLDDGRVLITGGTGSTGTLTSAELFNTDGSISVAAPMLDPRTHHTAVMLKDGRVLVAGGTTSGGGTTSAAEIYDPAGNSWTAVPGGMTSPRSSHTASLLSDGRVLVAGGATTAGATNTLEVYSPDTNSFTAVTSGMLSSVRQEHAAAVLADGRILIAGGSDGAASLNSTDIFDPATGSVAAGPAMASARAGLSATTLLDGKVLLTGGNNGSADLSTAEVYNASTGSISATGGLTTPRRDHLALLLPHNNGVLITGGSSAGAPLASAELFYPWTGAFTATGAMASPRTAAAGAALKQDGYLLVAGGSDGTNPLAATELYGFATIKTDKADYAPGQTVTISGSGWQPGETVTLTLLESPLIDTHGPFTAVADSNGNLANIDFVPDSHDLDIQFYLTATGSVSQAQTTFTDAISFKTLTVGAQTPSSVAPGNSATYSITTTYSGSGATCSVALTLTTALPTGATAVFSPTSVSSTSPNSTLTISTTGSTPPGATTFTAKGLGGTGCTGDTDTDTGTLVVVEPTTTTLVASPNPSTFGQSVTLTATVAQTAGPTTPTGSVTFKDGATTLGTGTLSGGVATLSTSALTVAGSPHSLTASYLGVTNTFGISTSNTVSQTVNKAGTTTTVTSSQNPSVFGQSVTFTAAVAAVSPGSGTATGTVTFKDGATTIGTGTLNGAGQATFATSSLSVAGHSITASYVGDTSFTGSTSSALTQTVNQADTTTTVTSATNPSVFGQSVTFTATVAAAAPGAGTPTGNVTFKDGATTLGSGTLNGSGQATFATSSLTVSAHSITAVYGSDTNFKTSTSGILTQTVNKASTTTTVSSATNPSTFGQSVTFTATVAAIAPGAGTPNGTVTFKDGATTLGTGTLDGTAQATFSTSLLTTGSHPITAVYGSDTNFNTSTSAALTQTVNKANTTTTVATSGTPTVFGQSVTFTATVAAVLPATTTPTGTVTFKDGATTIGTGPLNGSGVATFSTTTLSVTGSPHSITAVYGSDTNFNTSTSAAITQTVSPASTTTALTSSPNPSVFGQSVTFTATVTAVAPGAGTPTGTVTFKEGATTLGTGTLNGSGVATFSTTALSVAGSPHGVTAVYATDGNFATSTSPSVSQVVNQASTTTALTSSANPSVFGQPVTFTATVAVVAPGAGTPTGIVTFKDGATVLGTGTLNGAGVATFGISSLSVASHPITAVYGSDTNFSGGTSAPLSQVVNKANTSTVVTSSVNPSTYGQAVTLTATVTAAAPGAGAPTGSAQFFDGATSLGSGTLVSGVANITTTALSAGSHNSITAVFTSGDGNFNGSTSPAFSQSVSMTDSATTVASSLNPSQFGQSVTFTATVTYGSPAVLAASGCITFMDGGTTLANNVMLNASGQATFTTSSLTSGSHGIQANFKDQGAGCNAGNNLKNSNANLTQVVNKADTTTTVASSLNPSVFGQSVTFTATVNPVAPATATPAGTVNFMDGATLLGTGTLNGSGVATFSISALSVASHPITAVYGGSTSYNTSTSALLSQVVNQASTSTAVTSSLNPSTAGQTVTFTATVTAVAPGAGISSSGTVTFMDGATSLGSGSVNASGVATFSTSALSVSLSGHSITAVYGGNTNFAGSTSSAILQVVNPASTTTTVSSSLNPSNYGQSVTFTATVTSPGGTPAGTVDFKDGATTIGTGTLSGGTATFSTSALAVGTHSITAVYGANGNFAGSTSSALSQVVNAVATSTSIVSSLNPSFLGQSVTFTATVAPAAATGTVNFFDGPTLLGSGALVAGNATYTTTALTLGSHSITAVYLGDGNFTGSTSAILAQVVKSAVTTTAVTSSLNPSTFGASVTFTATVTPQDASAGTPSGNLTFYEGGDCTTVGVLLQAATLDGAGKATYSTSFSAGAHIVVACYAGNTTFNPSGGSVTQNVTQAATTTTLASSNTSSTLGQLVTFTATVSSTSGTPSGNVYIYDGTTLIGGGTLSAGATSFSTAVLSSGAGPHSLTAAYGGDTNFSPSNSSAISQTVGPRGTMTAVSLSPDTVPIGQASTATLTVTDKTEFGPSGTPGVFVGPAPALTYGRSGHTATRLPNGMVMVIGGHGSGVLTQVEWCDPTTGTCAAMPALTAAARTGHTATLLNNGKVLIVGGSSDGTATGAMNSVELFDPLTGTFSAGPDLGTARFGHTATLLPDGTVLIAGGQNSSGTALNTTEVYAGATWSAGGPLMTARAGHAAAMLPNGQILMTGGDGTSSAELYTPGGGSIPTAGSMSIDRTGHTATLLPDGNVLIAGGASGGTVILDSTELYNAVADTFTPVSATGHNLNAARSGHTATMLDSAHVLILGGSNATSLNSEELYTPPFDPLGKVNVTSSEATDVLAGSPCDLALNGSGATKCTVTDTPAQVDTNPHTITGNYQPASDYVHSTSSGTKDLTVTKADTTTLVTSSVNPSKFGQGVTFTATVTAVGSVTANLAGTVQFYDNGSPIGGPISVSGVGTATAVYGPVSSLTVGTHPITAIYSGNTNYNTSTSPGLDQVVQKSDTAAALISSQNPSVFGQSVTFTATVTAVPPGSGTPTGTVTFYDGATSLGTGTLNGSGVAAFSTTSLTVASHPITAKFGGDGNFRYSTSPILTQVVNKAETTTALTSSVNPSVFGQSVTFTATVAAVAPGAGTPSGTVTFKEGATTLGTGTLNGGGTATFTIGTLPVGPHSVTAYYDGDLSFNGSISSLLSQTVNKANTSTTLTSSVNPSVFGQSVTFTATVAAVAPGAGTPSGTVTFKDSATTLGTATLSGGVATFSTGTLPAGPHSITAYYDGDPNFNESTSSLLSQTVKKAYTSTTLTSSANPSVYGQSVTFTATVMNTAGASVSIATPTGSVQFVIDGVNFGSPVAVAGSGATATAASGATATLTVSGSPHSVQAVYSNSDGNFSGSTGSVDQAVQPAPLSITPDGGKTKNYGLVFIAFTGNVVGLQNGDAGTVTYASTGAPAAAGVGSYNITATFSFTAGSASNYSITYNTATNGLTVNPVPLSITASSAGMIYGGPVPPVMASYSGFVNGESAANLTTQPVCLTLATSASPVGTYASSCSGAVDNNYTITYVPGVVTVSQATSTTTVTSSLNPSNWMQVVMFTATVAPQFSGTPTGPVMFYNATSGATCSSPGSSTLLDTVPLVAGQASTSTSTLPTGTDTILACYSGDGNFISSSNTVAQTVIPAPIAVLSPDSLSFGNQQAGTTSGPQSVIISNPNGTAPLNIASITLTGTNPTYFTQTNNCTSVPVWG